ncbi:WYL domain-containing protein [Paenibacillus sp. 19GGS1-52]|uniref:WYL domain-containing protein n=1 Tax=Paenibacillus sp. 19GGS1-52 TaxID=2758563 RepID=UPI001EFB98A9|nr:WYL domain-containing protein [Paenibacillus sp. 19GGS1-52]ULO07397.1 WYL domain-containing protein [Paenibacillus sp. 19GGS1-52]
MNPFEKIFNFQIISRLDEMGSLALTSQERSWLKTMLVHPASTEAFTPDTLSKLNIILDAESSTEVQEIILEKAKTQERRVYHPMLRTLRRIIMQDHGILLSYHFKHGGIKTNQSGFPHKLEYNMFKREWYLQWYNTRHHSLMSTKLQNIISVEETLVPLDQVSALKVTLERLLEERKDYAWIQVVPTFNVELSRILYAFSCFEKSVSFDEDSGIYRIKVNYMRDESEFLLSKIRFLGLRVKIVEGEHLKKRMRESASKALARYADL